jgi:hypothetical protein
VSANPFLLAIKRDFQVPQALQVVPWQPKKPCSWFQTLIGLLDDVVADIGNAEALRVLVDKEGWCDADFAREVRPFGEIGDVYGVISRKYGFGRLVVVAACSAVATLPRHAIRVNPGSGTRWWLLGVRFGVEEYGTSVGWHERPLCVVRYRHVGECWCCGASIVNAVCLLQVGIIVYLRDSRVACNGRQRAEQLASMNEIWEGQSRYEPRQRRIVKHMKIGAGA